MLRLLLAYFVLTATMLSESQAVHLNTLQARSGCEVGIDALTGLFNIKPKGPGCVLAASWDATVTIPGSAAESISAGPCDGKEDLFGSTAEYTIEQYKQGKHPPLVLYHCEKHDDKCIWRRTSDVCDLLNMYYPPPAGTSTPSPASGKPNSKPLYALFGSKTGNQKNPFCGILYEGGEKVEEPPRRLRRLR